jgi:hypothetical protein
MSKIKLPLEVKLENVTITVSKEVLHPDKTVSYMSEDGSLTFTEVELLELTKDTESKK